MRNKSKPAEQNGPGLVQCEAQSSMVTGNFDRMLAKARQTYQQELADITRILGTAERCAKKGLRRLAAGDVLSARRWLDHACDAEYDALNDCEALGWLREALGNECPWRVVSHYYTDTNGRQLRLRVVTTCTHPRGCALDAGELIRGVDGSGVVVSEHVSDNPFVGTADGRRGAVVTWPEFAPIPTLLWKVDPSVVRCGFE